MKSAIEKKLESTFKRIGKKFGVSYAILFGSYASRTAIKESDLDIAVKLNKPPKTFKHKIKLITDISLEIERRVGIETDIVIINDAPYTLSFEIFKKGKLIFLSNRKEYINDKVKTMAMYQDFSFWSKPLFEKIKESVKIGRYG